MSPLSGATTWSFLKKDHYNTNQTGRSITTVIHFVIDYNSSKQWGLPPPSRCVVWLFIDWQAYAKTILTWAAQPEGVEGQCPHFWDQRGTGGTGGGPMKMIFASTADSLYSVLYSTSDWISTPLTLVDTCQVNDIWKDGLGRFSTVHPHWTAALFKSTCQHDHVAVNWLSMSLSGHNCQISLASSYFPASSSLYLLACTPTFGKEGVQFFSLALLANPVLYPQIKIRGAAHVYWTDFHETRWNSGTRTTKKLIKF